MTAHTNKSDKEANKMKITGIKGYHLSLPMHSCSVSGGTSDHSGNLYRNIPEEETASWAKLIPQFTSVRSLLIEMHTDDGVVGYGEVESDYGPSPVFRLACENLIGADPSEIQYNMRERVAGRSNTGRTDAPHPSLPVIREMAGLEFAMWDIAGKCAGLPVYDLLGGRMREKQAVSVIIGQKPVEQCLKEIQEALSVGIRTIKLRVGANDKRDIELLKEIRDAFGWEIILRADAGGAWGNVTEAVRVLREMDPYNLQYVEHALNRYDAESYRRLREMTGIPICMSVEDGGSMPQTFTALTRTAEIVRLDAADVISLSPAQAGGILGFTQVAAFSEGAGIEVIADRSLGGLSQAILLHAAATGNSCDYAQTVIPNGFASGCEEDYVCQPLTQNNGFMVAPAGPGFGVTLDPEKIKKFCIAEESVGEC